MTETPHPRETFDLIGHAEIERMLLEQVEQNRLPGAYLLIGAPGVGKATLAYRLARFLLACATPPPAEKGGLFGNTLPATFPSSLAVSKEHPAVSRMLAGSHADFLVLEPEWDDKKKAYKTEIPVEAARRIGSFLSHTAGEGRWKVVLIDPVDALNVNAANAILKWLEEPPANSVFLLISHNPGALLPTIRSRCRTLALSTPDQATFARILTYSGVTLHASEEALFHLLAGGSPGIALQLIADKAEGVYAQLLAAIESGDTATALRLSEKFTAGKDAPKWDTLERLLARFIAEVAKHLSAADTFPANEEEARAVRAASLRKPLDYWLELWNKGGALLADAERLHLNKKHALLVVLHSLMGHDALESAAG